MTEILFFFGLLGVEAIVVGLLAIFILRRNAWRLSSPLGIFLLVYAFIHLIVPAWAIAVDVFRFDFGYQIQSHLFANLYAMLYLGSVLISFAGLRGVTTFEVTHKLAYLTRGGTISAIAFLLMPFLIGTVYLYSLVSSVGVVEFMANRIVLLRGQGIVSLAIFLSYALVAIMAFHIAALQMNGVARSLARRTFLLLAVIGLIAMALFAYFLLGSRQTALMPFLFIVVGLSALGLTNRKQLVRIVLGFLVLIVALLWYGTVRSQLGELEADGNALTMELLSVEVSNAFGNHENLLWLTENQQYWTPLQGATFVAGFTNAVPRAIWPDKPFGGGPALKNAIFPGSYDLQLDNLTSFTTGLLTEAYMNFGLLGALLVGTIHGVLLAWLSRRWRSWSRDVFGLCIYVSLSVGFTLIFLTNEFLGGLTRLAFVALVLWLCREGSRWGRGGQRSRLSSPDNYHHVQTRMT